MSPPSVATSRSAAPSPFRSLTLTLAALPTSSGLTPEMDPSPALKLSSTRRSAVRTTTKSWSPSWSRSPMARSRPAPEASCVTSISPPAARLSRAVPPEPVTRSSEIPSLSRSASSRSFTLATPLPCRLAVLLKPPLPLLTKTSTDRPLRPPTAMSGKPSPFHSSTATAVPPLSGPRLTPGVASARLPLLKKTTVSAPAVTMSTAPSPSKSAARNAAPEKLTICVGPSLNSATTAALARSWLSSGCGSSALTTPISELSPSPSCTPCTLIVSDVPASTRPTVQSMTGALVPLSVTTQPCGALTVSGGPLVTQPAKSWPSSRSAGPLFWISIFHCASSPTVTGFAVSAMPRTRSLRVSRRMSSWKLRVAVAPARSVARTWIV